MADIRVQIPDQTVESMQSNLQSGTKATDIAKDALTLYKWAIDERAKGRVLITTDEQGNNPVRLAMPSLESVKVGSGDKDPSV